MSEEQYNQRQGTLRDWGRQQKQQNPNFTLRQHAKEHREWVEAQRQAKLGLELPKGFQYDEDGKVIRIPQPSQQHKKDQDPIPTEFGPDSIHDIRVGMRCEVQPGSRRGEVMYVGLVPELNAGYWVGVRFDEPVGKTDGSVPPNKSYYFTTPGTNYGGFIRGKNLRVGDFPERDIFLDDTDDDGDDDDDGEDEL
eukprot:CAMPEP_0202450412 /NCGR_PEP_ID=MMETSP1360-20130828/9019_1 /ASSEMBLY_ACC=CAM_ASM_000848 /TAXON_ID=515479 /ORGANISM="Licmophora paradoxa, Strain CCMP2313" /LENGTH=193 /DNA_ID=CAMNT_0049068661 /DNA_START=25 /DNA_END=606 /DNA_ORIENTATION=-